MKTQQHFLFLLLACCAMLFFSNCRKGEDDPAFSLRTRKARLVGEWKLESGRVQTKFRNDNGIFSERTYSFTGNTYESVVGGIGTFNGLHYIKLNITDEGNFTVEEQGDSTKLSGDGKWDFMSKSAEHKNKERVFFTLGKAQGNSLVFAFFNKTASAFSYEIRELRHKKMVLQCKEELVYREAGKSTWIVTAEYTFTQ